MTFYTVEVSIDIYIQNDRFVVAKQCDEVECCIPVDMVYSLEGCKCCRLLGVESAWWHTATKDTYVRVASKRPHHHQNTMSLLHYIHIMVAQERNQKRQNTHKKLLVYHKIACTMNVTIGR